MKTQTAYFEIRDNHDSKFVIKLEEESKIRHVRRILSGEETQFIHVQGTIVKKQAYYNREWSYHLDPKSIEFFQVSIEVCDASIQFIEDNLKEVCGATLPDCHWCPWSSRFVKEVFI
ncbi:hypothetical protein [Aquimarina sp. 2201CG5-10]|uniref:BP74-related protein n=1 Tax=Aquimarina callyspongiae TaxID=3098150 RepID=UPI002AB4A6B4|nr:hypothetical protein [Aquimarina sp. 2201CG5-10]MDY8135659.1 hypothetical protein [Aquimarina sp. 2201CG5-10]